MNARTPPPRGLRWADAWPARITVIILAAVCLITTSYLVYRYTSLTRCLSDRDTEDQRRTVAIAVATDAERRADLALIRGGPDPHALRAAAIAAREHTDQVRADHPAPPVRPCQ